MDRRFLIYTCSPRPGSNSRALAEHAATGISNLSVDWADLGQINFPPFADLRPKASALTPEMHHLWGKTAAATDLVFATPIYWYALPASAKTWLDYWSSFLEHPDLDFAEIMRGKTMWALTTRADPDPTVAHPIEDMLKRTSHWLGMRWGGALHAVADGVNEVQHSDAWAKAKTFLTHPPLV